MAEIDELLTQIEDDGLRSQLTASVEGLRRQLRFGLVFERHIPESIRLYGVPPRPGDTIQMRAASVESEEFQVVRANTRTVTATDSAGQEHKLPANDVVVLKKFGEPAYPALKPQGRISRSETKPYHSVINGENFHTLQLLRYLYRGVGRWIGRFPFPSVPIFWPGGNPLCPISPSCVDRKVQWA